MQKLNNVHGILLIDKPSGCTSHDVVAKVRRHLRLESVGHAGTLDPIASGLLIVLLGEATKLSEYILGANKGYEVKVRFGVETDSGDISGQVQNQTPAVVKKENLLTAIEELKGELQLLPPMFSAIKVNGKKLYQEARKQRETQQYDLSQLRPRPMRFYDVKLVDWGEDWATISLFCSKGSYIRSWAQELGKKLGCGGTVETLRRTWSDPYSLEKAITLSDFENSDFTKAQELAAFVSLSQLLHDWHTYNVYGEDARLMENGQISQFVFSELIRRYPEYAQAPDGLKVISNDTGKLVSLLIKEPGKGFKIRRVFRY